MTSGSDKDKIKNLETEINNLKEENARFRGYLSKYAICESCGYMCSADGEFHSCDKRMKGENNEHR